MDFVNHGAPRLTRYSSAPSTLLTAAVGENFATTENTFARLLPDSDPTCLPSEMSDFRPTVFGDKEAAFQHLQDGHLDTACSSPLLSRISENGGREPAMRGDGLSLPSINASARSNGGVLLRQSSSPAGLFPRLTVDSGYSTMSNVGSSGSGNASNVEMTSALQPSAGWLKQQLSFSNHASPSRRMPQIPEMSCDNDEAAGISRSTRLAEGDGDRCGYLGGFASCSLDDSRTASEKTISSLIASHTQKEGSASVHFPPPLNHQFSLPRTSAEMAALEQYLHAQASPQFKVRARRGCATHPRSIAERVRRTRISQRMRKLQELVPNMDKQTNTADMLDLAVDYIKDLRQKIQALYKSRSTCTCGTSQNTCPSSGV
ncbi:unnamed protein product [Victoria cruziana]